MEQMKQIPVYRQTGMYAREHGELEQFRQADDPRLALLKFWVQKEAAGKHVDGNFDDFIVVSSLDAAREICRLMNSKGSGVDS